MEPLKFVSSVEFMLNARLDVVVKDGNGVVELMMGKYYFIVNDDCIKLIKGDWGDPTQSDIEEFPWSRSDDAVEKIKQHLLGENKTVYDDKFEEQATEIYQNQVEIHGLVTNTVPTIQLKGDILGQA